ncbi:MAG: PIN domain-containing protein [Gallionella sp.]|nr:PIN domain-containing protein [Gallionella sp.]MDD4957861.1 PIN domain-containing protein [Gallionella sp.]
MGDLDKISELHEVLIIDLENCPNQLSHLPNNLEKCLRVVICYAQSSAKVPLNWLNPLSTAIAADKLKIVKMGQTGKNSADFGICFLAGALMQELPKETHFVIVSNDTDLDHAVRLLKEHGRSAERMGGQKEELPPTASQITPINPVAVYCAHLVTYSKNRPSKTDTLLASIRNKFKDEEAISQSVYDSLITRGAVKVAEKKVSYDDQKISALAKS